MGSSADGCGVASNSPYRHLRANNPTHTSTFTIATSALSLMYELRGRRQRRRVDLAERCTRDSNRNPNVTRTQRECGGSPPHHRLAKTARESGGADPMRKECKMCRGPFGRPLCSNAKHVSTANCDTPPVPAPNIHRAHRTTRPPSRAQRAATSSSPSSSTIIIIINALGAEAARAAAAANRRTAV